MNVVSIIDYGMGNLHSISKALQHVAPEAEVQVSSDPAKILAADRVVFPGVGAIRDCMVELQRLALTEVVTEASCTRPFLGVCLGMQAMMDHSEENEGTDGLALLPGQVRAFANALRDDQGERLKNPHMGWNKVQQDRPHPLWEGIPTGARFYFVHGYYVAPETPQHRIGTTYYPTPFASAVAKDRLFAVQFHPEKSQHAGLRLLQNFMHWNP